MKSSKFDQDTPIQQQMTEIPERVDEDQYKSLVQHWMSDKSKVYIFILVQICIAIYVYRCILIYSCSHAKSNKFPNVVFKV